MIRRRMTVKRVDPWSVLKLGLVINIAGAAILVFTGMVVWSVVRRLQLVDRICEPATNLLGLESCTVNGVALMRTGLLLAGLLVVVTTGVMVFSAFLYNLIADLTGGIEVSMLDHAGQVRSASGGVEVSPELRTTGAVAAAGTGRTTRAGPPPDRPARTGTTGPVMAPTGDPTLSSAAARPNTVVPLLLDDEPPPASASPADRPGMMERAAVAGAMVRGAADRTGAVLSEAGRRATTALTEATEGEAAARAQRAEASRQSLGDLEASPPRPGGGDGRPTGWPASPGPDGRDSGATREEGGDASWPGRRADIGTRRDRDPVEAHDPVESRDPAESRDARRSADGDGSGPDDAGAPSPQEAAAARVRAQANSGETPPRDADGRFVSPDPGADPSAEDLFGSHPKRSESNRGNDRGRR